jgi:hypothetical protein
MAEDQTEQSLVGGLQVAAVQAVKAPAEDQVDTVVLVAAEQAAMVDMAEAPEAVAH